MVYNGFLQGLIFKNNKTFVNYKDGSDLFDWLCYALFCF